MTATMPNWHICHGEVSILQESKALFQIETPLGKTFWVPKNELVNLTGTGPEAQFVSQLFALGYGLFVSAYNHSEQEYAELEYQEWSGEKLPADCIYHPPATKRTHLEGTSVVPTWRLYYRIVNAPPAPFRILPPRAGHTCKEPHGIIRKNAHHIEVNYKCIIERLVRAGLRAHWGYNQ